MSEKGQPRVFLPWPRPEWAEILEQFLSLRAIGGPTVAMPITWHRVGLYGESYYCARCGVRVERPVNMDHWIPSCEPCRPEVERARA